jgi:hypothetical protein
VLLKHLLSHLSGLRSNGLLSGLGLLCLCSLSLLLMSLSSLGFLRKLILLSLWHFQI